MNYAAIFNLCAAFVNVIAFVALDTGIFLVFGAIHLFLAAVRYNIGE